MILKQGADHHGLMVYTIFITDDPGLTLTYFTARSNLVKIAYCAYTKPFVRWAFIGPLVYISPILSIVSAAIL